MPSTAVQWPLALPSSVQLVKSLPLKSAVNPGGGVFKGASAPRAKKANTNASTVIGEISRKGGYVRAFVRRGPGRRADRGGGHAPPATPASRSWPRPPPAHRRSFLASGA